MESFRIMRTAKTIGGLNGEVKYGIVIIGDEYKRLTLWTKDLESREELAKAITLNINLYTHHNIILVK